MAAACPANEGMSKITIGRSVTQLTPQCVDMSLYTKQGAKQQIISTHPSGDSRFVCDNNKYLSAIRKIPGDGWAYEVTCNEMIANPGISTPGTGLASSFQSKSDTHGIGLGDGQYSQCQQVATGVRVYDDGYLAFEFKCLDTQLRQSRDSLVDHMGVTFFEPGPVAKQANGECPPGRVQASGEGWGQDQCCPAISGCRVGWYDKQCNCADPLWKP